jgi:hypothetical protein
VRRLLPLLAVLVVLSGCGTGLWAEHRIPASPSATCTPPPGGRCAADVQWPGQIMVSPGGRLLHGVINCGGTLHVVSQTADRVVVRLHVGAMGPGAMSCARVDVGTRLAQPLGRRSVYDAVTGRRLPVVVARKCRGLALRCSGGP